MWNLVIIGGVGISFEEFEQGHSEQRLFSETDEIAADAVVQHSLFGHVGELAIDLEHTGAGRDHH